MHDYTNHNDEELIRLFKAGDDVAFREIYLRYDKPLYLYAYHKLANKEEARDVIQDVFAWILNHRRDFDSNSTLSGYLYKAVLHKIYNIFKHKAVLVKYAGQSDSFLDLESHEADFLIREKDVFAMIEKTIAEMPVRMREVYELRSKQYMSAKDIAAAMGISEATVNTQMKRAIKQLKLKLGHMAFLLFI